MVSREALTHVPTEPAYTLLDHTADLALAVRGRSLEELFANAALGMFAQMVDLESVPVQTQHTVRVEADDAESLLVAWLSELLYLGEIHRQAYTRFAVHFPAPDQLEATIEGGPCHAFAQPIKAATFHGLHIEERDGVYHATIVFDV